MKWLVALCIFCVSTYGIDNVSAQLSPELMMEQMQREGMGNCELVVLEERMYVPMRIELFHEPVTNQIIETASQDPMSELFFEKSESRLGLITNSTDYFTIKVVLDYESKEDVPRDVGYTYQSENYIIERGTWKHEGFEFCKVFQVNTSVAPHIPTASEILDIAGEITKEKFDRVTLSLNENTDLTYIFVLVILIFCGVMTIMILLLMVARFRDTRKANRLKVEQAREYKEAKDQLDKAVTLTKVMLEQNRVINSKFNEKVDEMVERLEKSLARFSDGIHKDISTILHVRTQLEEPEEESLKSKVFSAVKENIPKSKDKSIDEMIKDKTYDEIKEIYNDLADKHKTNISHKEKTKVYDTCMKLADILDKMKKEGKKK